MLPEIQSVSAKESCLVSDTKSTIRCTGEKVTVTPNGTQQTHSASKVETPAFGAVEKEETVNDISSYYQQTFMQECASVIHCIRKYPLGLPSQDNQGIWDVSRIESEPTPVWESTMESFYLRLEEGSSKLDLTMQKAEGDMKNTKLSTVVEEGEEECSKESMEDCALGSKNISVLCPSENLCSVAVSSGCSPQNKHNCLFTEGGKETANMRTAVNNSLQNITSNSGGEGKKDSSHLIDAGSTYILHSNTSGSNVTRDLLELNGSDSYSGSTGADSRSKEVNAKNFRIAHSTACPNLAMNLSGTSEPGAEPVLKNRESTNNTYEIKEGLSDESVPGPNLTVTIPTPNPLESQMRVASQNERSGNEIAEHNADGTNLTITFSNASYASEAEQIPRSLEVDVKVDELKGSTADEFAIDLKSTTGFSVIGSASDPGTESAVNMVCNKDFFELEEHMPGEPGERAQSYITGELFDTICKPSTEAGDLEVVSLCSLDGSLDIKGRFLVTSTPLVMAKSFSIAREVAQASLNTKKGASVRNSSSGEVDALPSMGDVARPRTESHANLNLPSRLKCPAKLLKSAQLPQRHAVSVHSSNPAVNRKPLLPPSDHPSSFKVLLPPLRSSATTQRLVMEAPSSSGQDSLSRKMDLTSKNMASASSLETTEILPSDSRHVGTKIPRCTLVKRPLSGLPVPGVHRNQLDLAGSTGGPRAVSTSTRQMTALKQKASQPSTPSQKQPRGNADDSLPMSKRKRCDPSCPSTSRTVVKRPAAPTSTLKRPTSHRQDMWSKCQSMGTRRLSGKLMSKASGPVTTGPGSAAAKQTKATPVLEAKVIPFATTEGCGLDPQLSEKVMPTPNPDCESCRRYREEIAKLKAELQTWHKLKCHEEEK